MSSLKIRGYRVIASVRAWQEWEVQLDERGEPRLSWLDYEQDDVSGNKVEEWTFDGGDYCKDDYAFDTFEELKKFLAELPELAGVAV